MSSVISARRSLTVTSVADKVLCSSEPAVADTARAIMLSVQLPSVHGHRSGSQTAPPSAPGASIGSGRILAWSLADLMRTRPSLRSVESEERGYQPPRAHAGLS